MLYLLVVRVFGTAASKWYYLLILGWGMSHYHRLGRLYIIYYPVRMRARGKVIGCPSVVVVVGTKIARSQDIGI